MTDPQIANWIALAALAITVAVGGLGLAFRLGGLSKQVESNAARIRQLEASDAAEGKGKTMLEVALAEFRGTIVAEMNHMREGFAELKREMLWLRRGALHEMDDTGPTPPAPTPRKR